ncbi:MAG: hypothetical protein R3F45_07555 [Gammaproteobacteria bacterium]
MEQRLRAPCRQAWFRIETGGRPTRSPPAHLSMIAIDCGRPPAAGAPRLRVLAVHGPSFIGFGRAAA